MAQADGAPAQAVFTVHSGSAPKRENMSLFERLNAEKGLQLPVFGTPVLSAPRLHLLPFVSFLSGGWWRCNAPLLAFRTLHLQLSLLQPWPSTIGCCNACLPWSAWHPQLFS